MHCTQMAGDNHWSSASCNATLDIKAEVVVCSCSGPLPTSKFVGFEQVSQAVKLYSLSEKYNDVMLGRRHSCLMTEISLK